MELGDGGVRGKLAKGLIARVWTLIDISRHGSEDRSIVYLLDIDGKGVCEAIDGTVVW